MRVLTAAALVLLAACAAREVPVAIEPATQFAEDWPLYYPSETPVRNLSQDLVPVLAEPVASAAVVGQVAPGAGGLIQTCARAEAGAAPRFCRVAVGSLNALGWVEMARLAPAS